MSKILTRNEFTAHMQQNEGHRKAYEADHPLWLPEYEMVNNKPSWFIAVPPLKTDLNNYWIWCADNLTGLLRCYSSSGEEWWGFTEYDDIVIWIMRWIG